MPFGALPYGTAVSGTGNLAPKLAATGSATLGSAVSLDLSACLANAPGVLFVGGPGSKTALPVLGGLILVQPLVSVPITASSAGTLSLPLTIPSSAASVGVNLNFQDLFFDSGAAGGVSMSNGIELWIG